MKALLQIVAGGLVAFIALAMADEWRFFYDAWFAEPAATAEIGDDDRRAAEEAIRTYLTLMRHFYQSGGDPRFADRMPIASRLREELELDVDYLARNHRLLDPAVVRFEVVAVEPRGEDRLEVTTRESWRIRTLRAVDGREIGVEPQRGAGARYYLEKGATGWSVEGWQPVAAAALDEASR